MTCGSGSSGGGIFFLCLAQPLIISLRLRYVANGCKHMLLVDRQYLILLLTIICSGLRFNYTQLLVHSTSLLGKLPATGVLC